MGRPIPPQSVILHNNAIVIALVHGILTVSVLYTTLAFVFFICGPRPRKSLPPPSPTAKSSSSSAAQPTPKPSSSSAVQPKSSSPPPQPSSSSSSPKAPPLPPPGSMIITHVKANKEPTLRVGTDHKDGAGGGRSLLMSLSQKLTRNWTLKKDAYRARGKSVSTTFDEGDLIWKKQIILGERCRVPPNGVEDEDEVPVYDEHGLRVAPYHPRTPRSLPVSRTTSVIDMPAINFS